MRRLAILLVLVATVGGARAQSLNTNFPASSSPHPPPAIASTPAPVLASTPSKASAKSSMKPGSTSAALAPLQAQLAQAQQDNRDLLDLLKKQQGVLADIQYDRRLQSRQIDSLEARLEETLQQKNDLQTKVAKLEEDAALRTQAPAVAAASPSIAPLTNAPPLPATAAASAEPPPPDSYLPAPQPETATGAPGWHRVLTLKGSDSRKTDLFKITGRQWRVLWHNQDKPGKTYANTSALFINAFPRDDLIPQRICSKLGSGGDVADLQGSGNYYLNIEASGGTWEVAVEVLR